MEHTANSHDPGQPNGEQPVKSRRSLRTIILLLLLAVFLLSTGRIIRYFRQEANAAAEQQQIQQQYTGHNDTLQNTLPDIPADGIDVDFDTLCADYPDTVGYIYCPDTNINYVIQHGKGNDYYLTHGSDGTLNDNGSIFLEEKNHSDFTDSNTLIYGHHMKTGLMFANLTLYKDSEFYDTHPYMYLYTPQQNYRIDLYAGFVCEHNDEVFATALTQEQLARMAEKSTFTPTIGIPTGKTVTLSTCSYEIADGRYVLVGALTEIG